MSVGFIYFFLVIVVFFLGSPLSLMINYLFKRIVIEGRRLGFLLAGIMTLIYLGIAIYFIRKIGITLTSYNAVLIGEMIGQAVFPFIMLSLFVGFYSIFNKIIKMVINKFHSKN